MPVEIRELVIKTEIVSGNTKQHTFNDKEVQALRKQLLEECRRLITETTREKRYKR